MKTTLALLSLLWLSPRSFASEHAAHEHGVGNLNIAIEQSKIVMELRLPGDTAYGFEHQAKSKKEKEAVAKAKSELSNPSEFFKIDPKFGCEFKLTKVDPYVTDDDDHDEDHHGHGHDHGDSHAELHASYQGVCKVALKDGGIDLRLDKVLPRLHELRVQIISDSIQTSATLKSGSGKIKF